MANVMSTGIITIPNMKKAGYSPETAAARRRSDAAVGATRRVRRFDLGPTRLASLMTAPPLVRWKFDRTLAPGTKDFDRKRGKSR